MNNMTAEDVIKFLKTQVRKNKIIINKKYQDDYIQYMKYTSGKKNLERGRTLFNSRY